MSFVTGLWRFSLLTGLDVKPKKKIQPNKMYMMYLISRRAMIKIMMPYKGTRKKTSICNTCAVDHVAKTI